MPSILVAGFISNPKTEQNLQHRDYQNLMSQNITRGIQSYFKDKPRNTLKNVIIKNTIKTHHKVKKGDTLTKIARKYSITTKSLYQNNYLKNNNIHIGQLISISKGKT